MSFQWFNISLWLTALLGGIFLFVQADRKWFIDWVKARIPMPEERIIKMEKRGGIALITFSILNLIQLFLRYYRGGY
jgi:hypothetical protein